jgi:glycosyltransferase involved in cell wall biosynthesis
MLSVVIPVCNEQESLEELHRELSEVAEAEGYRLDVIFVDDGSTDRSWQIIERLAESDPRVRGLRFRRNFGKAAALSAGFAHARGKLVMTLDADLQDDPHEIPRFLAEMDKGVDVVSGWKQVRHDPWHKVGPSRVFNWMVSRLTGVKLHDHNCGMKCYRREIFDEVQLYGELHRFVPVLSAARGFRVGELVINHRPRKHGRSKYGVTRIVKGFLDLLTVKFLTGFGQRPQHMLGTLGLLSFALGLLCLLYQAGRWAVSRLVVYVGLVTFPAGTPAEQMFYQLHDRPIVLYSIALLFLGAQLVSVGFLAELLIAYHDPHVKSYSIAQRTGPAGQQPARVSAMTDD